MVHLSETSKVNQHTQPFAYEWDTLVRKNYNQYQKRIDALTYQLQRTQRTPISFSYPRFYNSELNTLNLLKKKQSVGEVTQNEINLYKNVNACISSDFNRTFNHSFLIPKLGLAVGCGLFIIGSNFNFSIPTRVMLLAVPLVFDFFRMAPDILVNSRTSEFLDWVIEYRKAKSWIERYRKIFRTEQAKKVIGPNTLPDLGRQLIALAQ